MRDCNLKIARRAPSKHQIMRDPTWQYRKSIIVFYAICLLARVEGQQFMLTNGKDRYYLNLAKEKGGDLPPALPRRLVKVKYYDFAKNFHKTCDTLVIFHSDARMHMSVAPRRHDVIIASTLTRILFLVIVTSLVNGSEDLISGKLVVQQDGKTIPNSMVSTNVNTTLVVVLNDINGYLQTTKLSFAWIIEDKTIVDVGSNLSCVFSTPGNHTIHVIVVAKLPPRGNSEDSNYSDDDMFRWGFFSEKILAKEPISSVNVSGNVHLYEQDVLELKVICSGSGPYEFCWEVLDTKQPNSSGKCRYSSTNHNCTFPVMHVFPRPGFYRIKLYLSNGVDRRVEDIDVNVSASIKTRRIAPIVISVVCLFLLVTFIIIFAVYHHHQLKKKRKWIEVADFDFESSIMLIKRSLFRTLHPSYMSLF
ncbi:uncharacterized protein LOC143236180 [Tachypleus tridentatus]|uniref:uncharacterized protein LOC143236180 n=1 Tax=Tachypleus tridentatus TaxID=6853 RepID=UPI003FCF828F